MIYNGYELKYNKEEFRKKAIVFLNLTKENNVCAGFCCSNCPLKLVREYPIDTFTSTNSCLAVLLFKTRKKKDESWNKIFIKLIKEILETIPTYKQEEFET